MNDFLWVGRIEHGPFMQKLLRLWFKKMQMCFTEARPTHRRAS